MRCEAFGIGFCKKVHYYVASNGTDRLKSDLSLKGVIISMKKRLARILVASILAALLAQAFGPAAMASAETVTVEVPAGAGRFEINLAVDGGAAPYAGIEFGITISNPGAADFVRFVRSPATAGATNSPFGSRDGVRYFGFFANGNIFTGANMVGTLEFENYTGANITITLTYMNVVRMHSDGTASETVNQAPVIVFNVLPQTEVPAETFTINAAAGANGTVAGGGTFISGALVSLVATADTGFVFEGWYEDGARVAGAGAAYSFNAAADRTLEARFATAPSQPERPSGGTPSAPPAAPPDSEDDPGATEPAPADYARLAQELHRLSLFQGYGNDDAGNPVFGLEDELTRIQALVLTIRLLGLEDAALAYEGGHPFTDIGGWQVPYVAYAFANGLTTGVSEDMFAPRSLVTLQQFATFMLRALGYAEADGDFEYADAIAFALSVGLLTEDMIAEFGGSGFLRSHAVRVMAGALLTEVNEEDGAMLLYALAEAGVFSQASADAFLAAVG